MTTSPRPSFPFAGWALAGAVGLGLAALAIAAYTAFSSVMVWYHALFAAGVVEVGAVVESLALARARNWGDAILALLAVCASVVVSATYNYTQVAQAAAALNISQWELTMLALGPLVALVFLSLNLGRQLRAHEQAVSDWHKANAHAAQSKDAQAARTTEQAAYDARRDAERNAQRAHELALAEIAARAQAAQLPSAIAQFALGGGDVQPATVAQGKTRKPTTAQRVAQWRADNPQWAGRKGAKAACAKALELHPSQMTRNWK